MRNQYRILAEKYEHTIGKHAGTESKVDPSELKKGIKTEMEHTNDPKKAKQIALDHLSEDPHYYSKLTKAGLEEGIAGEIGSGLGRTLGRAARGMVQRAKDVQDARGKTTPEIMGTQYPRAIKPPRNMPYDFERSVERHRKDLALSMPPGEIEKVSKNVADSVVTRYRNTIGVIDVNKLTPAQARVLTNMVDDELKLLKKRGTDKEVLDRINYDVMNNLGLDIYRYRP